MVAGGERSVASAWKLQADASNARAFAADQRERSAKLRAQASAVRADAARLRADAARVRDDGARIRDGAARVRDGAALVRDEAARARDASSRTREEAFRKRVAFSTAAFKAEELQAIVEVDRCAAEESRAAAVKDREAARLDRAAAEKDREAAEQDRVAAERDREASDKDAEAANMDAEAADADRAAAESNRAEAEREASAAEARLAGSLAHEISNPLTALLAVLEILHRTESARGDDLRPLIDDAALAAGRIAHVVRDLRTWIGTSIQPPYAEVDPAALVEESLTLTHDRLENVARVVVDVQPTPPLWGIRARLGQVLTNLLLNAANAISGLRDANQIHVSVRSVGATVRIEVRDTGSGIDPAVLPHIFEMFFTTHAGSGGTGVGLALCQRIVAEHGGTISVESKVGEGSSFHVDLPVRVPPKAQAGEPRPSVPRRARVLVIDDDKALSRSIGRLLASLCDVTLAHDGSEGLACLLAPGTTWDLVLCDLTMPRMNGMELYRRVLEAAPQLAVEIVFTTGGIMMPEMLEFLRGVPNLLLEKPLDFTRLFEIIAERTGSQEG